LQPSRTWATARQTSSESGEARRAARALANAEEDEKVVDLDVECDDEGVDVGLHKPSSDALPLLVTACCPFAANSESLI